MQKVSDGINLRNTSRDGYDLQIYFQTTHCDSATETQLNYYKRMTAVQTMKYFETFFFIAQRTK